MAASVYQIDLADGISGPANEAAAALKRLQSRIDADRGALRSMEREMKALQKGAVVDIEAFRTLQGAIDKKRLSIERASNAFIKLSSGQIGTAAQSVNLRGALSEVGTVAQALPSQLGGPIDRVAKLSAVLAGSVTPAVAARVAMVAFFAAVGAGIAALARYGIAQADARRQEALHLQQLTRLRLGAGALADLQSAIEGVSSEVSLGRDEVAKYGAELARAGLRGGALESALLGTAITASALGDKAGDAFARAARGPGQTAASLERLASTAKAKLGGVVQAQMLTLENQSKKAAEGVSRIFSGLRVEGYLKALKAVRDAFTNVNTASGRALKGLAEAFGQPLINAIAATLRWFKSFFVQVQIGVYQLLIAYQLARLAWEDTFGKSNTQSAFAAFFKSFQLGRVVVYVLAAAFAALALNVIAATWPFLAAAAAVYWLAAALQNGMQQSERFGVALAAFVEAGANLIPGFIAGVKQGWEDAKTVLADVVGSITGYFKSLLGIASPSTVFAEFGASIADGLFQGMSERWEALKSGVATLASDLADTFASVLEIGSPSKVFERFGDDVSMGVAVGVKQGAPAAQSAVAGLVDVPSIPRAATPESGVAAARAAAPSVTISIGEVNITAPSADAPTLASSLRRELESVLETLAFETGVAPAGAQ